MDSRQPAVKRSERHDGGVEYYVLAAEGWDDCASLAQFIVKHFGAVVHDQADGICSREWRLRIGKTQICLKHHEDLGNYFYADPRTAESDELSAQIAAELNVRLSNRAE